MKAVFADTFYWVALYNRRDEWHDRAKVGTKRLFDTRIVTSEEVLVEVLAALADKGPVMRRHASGAVRKLPK